MYLYTEETQKSVLYILYIYLQANLHVRFRIPYVCSWNLINKYARVRGERDLRQIYERRLVSPMVVTCTCYCNILKKRSRNQKNQEI